MIPRVPGGRIHGSLTPRQETVLAAAFPGMAVAADHSWPTGATVLEFVAGGGRYILKAAEDSHHIVREARAHQTWLGPLAGNAPELVLYDGRAGLLVTRHLPGHIALGSPAAGDPDVFRQAGSLLAHLHRGAFGGERASTRYEAAMVRRSANLVERSRGLAPAEELETLARWLRNFAPSPVELVPTHGDFQPRNWLVRPDGRVALIDFGRADLRPWYTDLVRLEHQELAGRGDLRSALLEGYGGPSAPPRSAGWMLDNVLQSLGTVVWAHERGDAAFERQGRGMLATTVRTLGEGPWPPDSVR